ncbi:MAG TPA: hypothetical protein VNK52_08400 [Hyphomicrobiaceae bacterium]|nr:hypothetical protein [Hyphomicrobiaceae bacterium]
MLQGIIASTWSHVNSSVSLIQLLPWELIAAATVLLVVAGLATAAGRRAAVRLFGSLWHAGFWILTKTCTGLEWALVAILRPTSRDGSFSVHRGLGWIAANVGVLMIALFLGAGMVATFAIGLFVVLHGLIILGGLLVVNEESDVMDGIMLKDDKEFSENSPLRKIGVLAPSVVFFVLGEAGLLYRIDAVHGWRMVEAIPIIVWETCGYCSYLLVTVEQLPGANLVIGSHNVAFLPGPGKFYQGAVYFSATLLLIAVFVGLFKQYKQVQSLMVAFDEAKHRDDVTYLHMRASRAPAFIRRWIAFFAVSHPNVLVRQRMLALVRRLRIFSFLPASLFRLHQETKDLKRRQLDTIEGFLDERTDDIDDTILGAVLSNLRYQTETQWSAHGEGARNRLDRLVVRLSKIAVERGIEGFFEIAPRKRLIDIAISNHQNMGGDAAPIAEEVDAVTLCNRLLCMLEHLPTEKRTWAVHLCVQIVSRKGPKWRERHLKGLARLAARVKKRTANDNNLRAALDDVGSEVIRARVRRTTAAKAAVSV